MRSMKSPPLSGSSDYEEWAAARTLKLMAYAAFIEEKLGGRLTQDVRDAYVVALNHLRTTLAYYKKEITDGSKL
jgi:hypothetical protein